MRWLLGIALGLALCGCPEHTNHHLKIASPHPAPAASAVLATR